MRRMLSLMFGATPAPRPAGQPPDPPSGRSSPPPASGPASEGVERTWTSTDGLELSARDYAPAAGPARLPVICLHGLTRNSRDFDGVAPAMAAAGRRVLALDVRGRGRSAHDPNPSNYNPAVYAGDVAALMTEAGIARGIFLGTSMGGLIAMTLATLRPDLIAGAILNDIGPEIATEGLTRIGSYVGAAEPAASWAEAAQRSRAVNGVALPNLSDAGWMTFARRTWREIEPGRIVPDYDPAIAQAFAGAPAGSTQSSPDLWPLFMALAMNRPLLLIRGGQSDLLTTGTAGRMQALAPQMRRLDIDGVGHAPTLDEPEARSAILDFLKTAP
ncbi:alpha/beta fold hydrolase [Phenylobacterium sp.]|uniref:alpha/beta fold hydrolase n=1 Tax=Phenylobacterium sp. TaxID=1871053 RepID=UPI00272F10BE|nr:alpha/beta hydrolase [Phenylobacterium sp.]MDP1618257.1 alpha/beta hydrolase [Phenylobacterium sp.]MDP1986846.1 alpha/beta hydrolase [Phenylobacterium sp.]